MLICPNSNSQGAWLPPEVLIWIFELATNNSTRDIDYLVDLPPFEAFYTARREARDREALTTKCSLALTCSMFRRVSMRLLYEDVWIRYGVEALLETLQASKAAGSDGIGIGKFVKRVTLLPDPEVTAEDVPRILSLCPNTRVLCRPYASESPSSVTSRSNHSTMTLDDLHFHQMHRIDWSNTLAEGVVTALHLTPHFVWNSPTLRVLTLSSDNLSCGVPEPEEDDGQEREILINLPQLHTLRLRSCDALGDPDEFWFPVQLPSLQRIILERPLALYALHAGCLAFYGSQIKTFEIGRFKRFLRIDSISIALGYCPNVEMLMFPVFTTMPPAKNLLDVPRREWIRYRVKQIGLNASVEEGLGFDHEVRRTWMWVQLDDLVDAFLSENTRFTALERITLYGEEWREFIKDDAFEPIAKAISSSRVRVDSDDHVTSELLQKIH